MKRTFLRRRTSPVRLGNEPAYHGDETFYRGIVFVLGTITIFGVVGMLLIAWKGGEIPDAVTAIVSGAAGSLGTTIAGSRSS